MGRLQRRVQHLESKLDSADLDADNGKVNTVSASFQLLLLNNVNSITSRRTRCTSQVLGRTCLTLT